MTRTCRPHSRALDTLDPVARLHQRIDDMSTYVRSLRRELVDRLSPLEKMQNDEFLFKSLKQFVAENIFQHASPEHFNIASPRSPNSSSQAPLEFPEVPLFPQDNTADITDMLDDLSQWISNEFTEEVPSMFVGRRLKHRLTWQLAFNHRDLEPRPP